MAVRTTGSTSYRTWGRTPDVAYAHGSVVLAPASFKGGLQPYPVVSNANRPYFGEEYTVAVITTRSRSEAVELLESRLTDGRLVEFPSYANPWSLHVVQHDEIRRRVAQVSDDVLEEVADRAHETLRPLSG